MNVANGIALRDELIARVSANICADRARLSPSDALEDVCRIRCNGELHRIVWTGKGYVAPDHPAHHTALEAISGSCPRCALAAKSANESLCAIGQKAVFPSCDGKFRGNAQLTRHVRSKVHPMAAKYLASVQLPFDAETVVSLRWLDDPSVVGAMGQRTRLPLDTPTMYGTRLLREPKLVGKALLEVEKLSDTAWQTHNQTSRFQLRYYSHQNSDQHLVLLSEHPWNRAVLWYTDNRCAWNTKSWRPTGSPWADDVVANKGSTMCWTRPNCVVRTAWGYSDVVPLANFVATLMHAWEVAQVCLERDYLRCSWNQAWQVCWNLVCLLPAADIRGLGETHQGGTET